MTETQRRIHRDTGDPAPRDREVPTDTPAVPALERAIAVQVRTLRRATGLSVADMASKAGISKAMLSKIENAQTSCSLSTLAKLAAMLDVPVTALLRGADSGREASYTEAGTGRSSWDAAPGSATTTNCWAPCGDSTNDSSPSW